MNLLKKNLGLVILVVFFIIMLSLIIINQGNQNKEAISNENKDLHSNSGELYETGGIQELAELLGDDSLLGEEKLEEEIEEEKLEEEKLEEKKLTETSPEELKEEKLEEDEVIEIINLDEAELNKISTDETLLKVNNETESVELSNFKVNVRSLKLNNIYFNKALAYLSFGDELNQLSKENYKGCFNVEVIGSSNVNNVGKKGYVCKKYLLEKGKEGYNDIVKDVDNSISSHSAKLSYKKLGDNEYNFFAIKVNALKLNNSTFDKTTLYLNKGDILKQIGDNVNGCFKIRITISENKKNLGKQGYVCRRHLKEEILESTWLAF